MTQLGGDISMMLGKMEGRLVEISHNLNNVSTKMDVLSEKVAANSKLPDDVADLQRRIKVLEEHQTRGEGARGVGRWISQSPMLMWLAVAALAIWTWVETKVGR